jgi:hypothetical protein
MDDEQLSHERPGVSWSFTCTVAPVQAEGTVGNQKFYFRSRWETWTFGVSSQRQPDPALVDSSEDGFYLSGRYGSSRYEASYMPLPEAKAIIDRCLDEYGGTPPK